MMMNFMGGGEGRGQHVNVFSTASFLAKDSWHAWSLFGIHISWNHHLYQEEEGNRVRNL